MPNPQKSPVHDLRSALELLKTLPGELVSTDVEVDPIAELSGVYRYVGAGGTCQRPTRKNGPAMLFNKVKGYPGIQVAIGLVGSRKRVGQFLNCAPERLGFLLKDSAMSGSGAPSQRSRFRPAHPAARTHQHRGRRRTLFHDGFVLCLRPRNRQI